MVTDAGRATTCRRKFKAPSLQTESTKKWGPSENDFHGKTVWRFETKWNTPLSLDQTTSWNTRPLNATIVDGPCKHQEIKRRKIEKKAIRLKLFDLCKTRTKKSSPDLFNFYVVFAGHDKVGDAGKATTCRRKCKAPSLWTKSTKNEGHSENMGCNGKTVWRFRTIKRTEHCSRLFRKTQSNTRTLKAAIEHGPRRQ